MPKKHSYQAYHKLTHDVLLQSVLHIINKIFSIFILNYTSPPPSPSPTSPKNGQKKKLLARQMEINLKCQMKQVVTSCTIRDLWTFSLHKIYIWREARGNMTTHYWKGTRYKCIFWRKKCNRKFSIYLF